MSDYEHVYKLMYNINRLLDRKGKVLIIVLSSFNHEFTEESWKWQIIL